MKSPARLAAAGLLVGIAVVVAAQIGTQTQSI